jgi:hypothetical protein
MPVSPDEFSGLAGRAGAAQYVEKSHPDGSPDALSPADYMSLLQVLLCGGQRPHENHGDPGYVPWALEQATSCLPPFLAHHCGKIANALKQGDWGQAGLQLTKLREHVVTFAWAQAAALCRAFLIKSPPVPPGGFNGAFAVEKHLRQLWEALDQAGRLGAWKGYVSEQDETGRWRSAGGALFGDTYQLRWLRNEAAHLERPFSRADYEAEQPAILAIIDALAFWADNPLMNAVRTHPDDRRRLEFLRLSGQPPWSLADLVSTAQPQGEMRQRRERVHVLHRDARGEHLVDLHPFVTMKSVRGRDPLPCLLIPPQPGSPACWVSLLDYSRRTDLPVEEDEAAIFGEQSGRPMRRR